MLGLDGLVQVARAAITGGLQIALIPPPRARKPARAACLASTRTDPAQSTRDLRPAASCINRPAKFMTEASYGTMKQRMLINTESKFETLFGHSRAVRAGRHVYVAGTTATTPDGPVGGDDMAAQTREAFRRVELALHRAGAGLRDVVRTRIFVTDMDAWPDIARIHASIFEGIRPASTIVEVSSLVLPGLLVEVEADAVITDPEPGLLVVVEEPHDGSSDGRLFRVRAVRIDAVPRRGKFLLRQSGPESHGLMGVQLDAAAPVGCHGEDGDFPCAV
jgi:enamine deaminase RidA (YjgF/YER057c/UK114 family)